MDAVDAILAQMDGRMLAELSDFDRVRHHATMAILRGAKLLRRPPIKIDRATNVDGPLVDDEGEDEDEDVRDRRRRRMWVRASLDRMASWEAGGDIPPFAPHLVARPAAPLANCVPADGDAAQARVLMDTPEKEPALDAPNGVPNAAMVQRLYHSMPKRGVDEVELQARAPPTATAGPTDVGPVGRGPEDFVLEDTVEDSPADGGGSAAGSQGQGRRVENAGSDGSVVDFGCIDLDQFEGLDFDFQAEEDDNILTESRESDELTTSSRRSPVRRPERALHSREVSSPPIEEEPEDLEDGHLDDGDLEDDDREDGHREDGDREDGDREDDVLEDEGPEDEVQENDDGQEDDPDDDAEDDLEDHGLEEYHEGEDEQEEDQHKELYANSERDAGQQGSESDEESDKRTEREEDEEDDDEVPDGRKDEDGLQSDMVPSPARSAAPPRKETRPTREPLAVLFDGHLSPIPSIPASPVEAPPLHSPARSPSPPPAKRRRTQRMEGSRSGVGSAISPSAAPGQSNGQAPGQSIGQSSRYSSAGRAVEERDGSRRATASHLRESPVQVGDDDVPQAETIPVGGGRLRQRQLAALAPFLVQNEEWDGMERSSTGDTSTFQLGWPLQAAESDDENEVQDRHHEASFEAVAAMETIDLATPRQLEEWVLSLKKNSNPNRIGDVRKLVREVPHTVAAVSDVYSQLLPDAAGAWQACQGWNEEVGQDDAALVLDYAQRNDEAEEGRDEAELLLDWLDADDEGEERQERLAANLREVTKEYRTDMLPKNLVDAIGERGTEGRRDSDGECSEEDEWMGEDVDEE